MPTIWHTDDQTNREWGFVGGVNRCGSYCAAYGCGANQTQRYTQEECEYVAGTEDNGNGGEGGSDSDGEEERETVIGNVTSIVQHSSTSSSSSSVAVKSNLRSKLGK